MRASLRRAPACVGLACILFFYVISVLRMHPANFFGLTQDDSIYFSSAKALAEGKGYVLPNLPGMPPATKYPILYPWILSWVWRWNPAFPGNIAAALRVTLVFGIAFISLAFLFIRRLRGIGNVEALLLTAFCVFDPTVLFYSSSALSDVPFAAMALGAMLLADRAMRREAGAAGPLACGILTALSILLRVLGVPIAAGILMAALLRRAWKQAAILAACITPALAWMVWHALASVQTAVPADFNLAGPAARQTWIYYMSYLGFRKLSLMNAHVAADMLLSQFVYFLTDLPGYFTTPLFHRHIAIWAVSTIAVFGMVMAGLARQVRSSEWQPTHVALPFTAAVMISWDYPEVMRFLLPFLPLLAATLWLEGKWIAGELAAALRARKSAANTALAAGLGVAFCALVLGIAWNALANSDRAMLRDLSVNRAALLAEKREAYQWLAQNAPADARVVAGEDGCLYLYTGRQAMAHIALQRASAYDETYLRDDLLHMTDVAKAIDAQYWVGAFDDSDKQWVAAKPFLERRFSEIEGALPELFRSSGGHVRIYGAGCVRHPEDAACRAADHVLFPGGGENTKP